MFFLVWVMAQRAHFVLSSLILLPHSAQRFPRRGAFIGGAMVVQPSPLA